MSFTMPSLTRESPHGVLPVPPRLECCFMYLKASQTYSKCWEKEKKLSKRTNPPNSHGPHFRSCQVQDFCCLSKKKCAWISWLRSCGWQWWLRLDAKKPKGPSILAAFRFEGKVKRLGKIEFLSQKKQKNVRIDTPGEKNRPQATGQQSIGGGFFLQRWKCLARPWEARTR